MSANGPSVRIALAGVATRSVVAVVLGCSPSPRDEHPGLHQRLGVLVPGLHRGRPLLVGPVLVLALVADQQQHVLHGELPSVARRRSPRPTLRRTGRRERQIATAGASPRTCSGSWADGRTGGPGGRRDDLEVDAIANAANTQLLHGGGVAGAISRAGGPAVQRESDERAPIGLGEAVETTAGDMPARWVIHAATMELGGPTSADDHRARDPLDAGSGRAARLPVAGAGRVRHRRGRLPARRGGAAAWWASRASTRAGSSGSSSPCTATRRSAPSREAAG